MEWLRSKEFTKTHSFKAGLYLCDPGNSHHSPAEESINHRWGAQPFPRGHWEPISPPGWGLQALSSAWFFFSSPCLIHKNPLRHVDKGFSGTKDKVRAHYSLVASQNVEWGRHFCGFGGSICNVGKSNKSGRWQGTKCSAKRNSFLTPLFVIQVIFVMSWLN